MNNLSTYSKKRNLKSSKEPEPKIKKSSKKLIFIIHEHHARNVHFDLRLEMNGILKSWAIPKSPPMTKEIKRLAIQVEDHPLDYAKFQGIIPEGNYGAGKVIIWDNGTYELINKTSTPNQVGLKEGVPRNIFKKMFTRGKIEFVLHGKKLQGNYVLIKTNYGNKPEKSWLFFKV